MDKIMEIAKKHNIKIAEDTSQACGGTFEGKYLGILGDFDAHSFQYHKIITAGKGGIVATNDKLLYDIYHMQIMEGNIIATIEKNIDVIGHFHADGVPGRHELYLGELNYYNIIKRIDELAYEGYIGLEYFPSMDSEESLRRIKERILV